MPKEVARFRCAKCNHRLSEDQPRCGHCGWEVNLELARAKAAAVEAKRAGARARRRMRVYDYIIVGLLALVLAACIFLLLR
ncbi:MAG TPA: hypothetical protein VKX17_08380 [Planctomycetota bacterium]|nr:hypothetical protein [Planctomycetota bacterium]